MLDPTTMISHANTLSGRRKTFPDSSCCLPPFLSLGRAAKLVVEFFLRGVSR